MIPPSAEGFRLRRLQDADRPAAAQLLWDGFASEIGRILAPRRKALAFLGAALSPDQGIGVTAPDGRLLGIAGFSCTGRGFIAGGYRELRTAFGTAGALWRAPLLDLFEAPEFPDQLRMDGLCVAAEVRGKGLGSLLLDGILAEARARDMAAVRLAVTDRNPRARALYERKGFVPGATARTGVFAPIMGFRTATQLVRPV